MCSSVSVFLMFFAVLLFFREPSKSSEARTESIAVTVRNFGKVVSNPKFMLFLLIFSGYWIVYWQSSSPCRFTSTITLTPRLTLSACSPSGRSLLSPSPYFSASPRKRSLLFAPSFWERLFPWWPSRVLALHSSLWAVYRTLVVVAVGELIQQPRYYEYISRLAPAGQQGTYMGFAFLPLGIGSFLGGPIGGALLHHFGEIQHQPQLFLWALTAIGLVTTLLLWIYDRIVQPGPPPSTANSNA